MKIHREGEDIMTIYEMQPDEVILYEGNVSCPKYKGNLQVVLTSQKVVFEKEKGLFKKEHELVGIIPLESVKLYNDAVQIKQKGSVVEMQTVGENLMWGLPRILTVSPRSSMWTTLSTRPAPATICCFSRQIRPTPFKRLSANIRKRSWAAVRTGHLSSASFGNS